MEAQLREKDDIPMLVNRIKRQQDDFLHHLRESIPLQPEHVPLLFQSRHHVPLEFYYLYQDCWFLTPGAITTLEEFLIDES